MKFVECDSCKAKPGAPTLCAGCLMNRDTIRTLMAREEHLTFRTVANINSWRSKVWHPSGKEWSLLEWAGAMCGEAGEAANVAKKIRRIEMGLNTPKTIRASTTDRETLVRTQLAPEIGDTYIYLDLLAAKAGLKIEDCIRLSFNAKSEELGFPQRIP